MKHCSTKLYEKTMSALSGTFDYMKILNNAVSRLTLLYFLLLISIWQKKLINKFGKGCFNINMVHLTSKENDHLSEFIFLKGRQNSITNVIKY